MAPDAGDSLPSLQSEDGGPWDIVQAYWPGAHFAKDKPGLYVDALKVDDPRVSNARVRPQYQITLTLTWPVKGRGATAGASGTARIPETEQQNLDGAKDADHPADPRLSGRPHARRPVPERGGEPAHGQLRQAGPGSHGPAPGTPGQIVYIAPMITR